MKIIYICGPYRANTERDLVVNIRRAELAALFIWQNGGAAICPHMNTAFFGGACPDKVWLEGDLEILKRCDGVFTTKYWQESIGAKAEVELAKELGIPVFHFYTEMKAFLMGESGD